MGRSDLVDALFGVGDEPGTEQVPTESDYYPGSKRKRRPVDPEVLRRQQEAVERSGWDAKPIMKSLGGKPVEMYPAGALALALGRPLVTIRMWERKGYIPRAPYRLSKSVVGGKEYQGRRYYTRALIESAVEEFSSRGLLDAVRINWADHTDLPIALVERWREIQRRETGATA